MPTPPATRIELKDFRTAPMRAFHTSWIAFFLCFFAWFAIAPLMPLVRDELGLTQKQVADTIIASVAITIVARIVVGRLCDRYGPRRTYAWLMVLGSLPVMGIGLAQTYEAFLLVRLAIGVVGASFVITQYHTTLMFAPNVVGLANATTAGWGNLGGGVTQFAMPMVLALLVGLGVAEVGGWRVAMIVPGLTLLAMGLAYGRLTQDTPGGNFEKRRASPKASFSSVVRDPRVWVLFVVYGACFGIELTINNVAALYFVDEFGLGLAAAGLAAASFGLMNLFARSAGGWLSDRSASRWGLRGRVGFLVVVLAAEGLGLALFASAGVLLWAIVALIGFSLCVQMAEGATFGIVPFVNPDARGTVTGIVAAGGNAGAVAAGFVFRIEGVSWSQGLLYLGGAVAICSLLALAVRFSAAEEEHVVQVLRKIRAAA